MSTYTIGIGNAVRDAGASFTAFPGWRGCESIINISLKTYSPRRLLLLF